MPIEIREEFLRKLRTDPFHHKIDISDEDISKAKKTVASSIISMFQDQSRDEDEFIEFWNSFQSKESLLFHLYFVSKFYRYYKNIFESIERELKQPETILSTVCLFFVVDAILFPEFLTFDQYLEAKFDTFQELLKQFSAKDAFNKVRTLYQDEFSSRRNIRKLLRENLDDSEKAELLLGFEFAEEISKAIVDKYRSENTLDELREHIIRQSETFHIPCKERKMTTGKKCSMDCEIENFNKIDDYLDELVDNLLAMRASVVHKAWPVKFVGWFDKESDEYVLMRDVFTKRHSSSIHYFVTMGKERFNKIILNALWRYLLRSYLK